MWGFPSSNLGGGNSNNLFIKIHRKIGGDFHPFWLIFFRWVGGSTTNQRCLLPIGSSTDTFDPPTVGTPKKLDPPRPHPMTWILLRADSEALDFFYIKNWGKKLELLQLSKCEMHLAAFAGRCSGAHLCWDWVVRVLRSGQGRSPPEPVGIVGGWNCGVAISK